jgi:hypothetical protein
LRTIASLGSGKESIDEQKDYLKKFSKSKKNLGEDYLENIKKRSQKFSKKIIVAINNRIYDKQ